MKNWTEVESLDEPWCVDPDWWKVQTEENIPRCPTIQSREKFVPPLEQKFNELAAQWYRETRVLSFIQQKAVHPAYQSIIGMGEKALPFIFREVAEDRGDWLWALEHITKHLIKASPVAGVTNFKECNRIWLDWGREHGYISK